MTTKSIALTLGAAIIAGLFAGCGSTPPAPPAPPAPPIAFSPGVGGRSAFDTCQTTSEECRTWTELARKCEDNMRRRDSGFMGRLEPFCDQAEDYRERVTGVADSSEKGAYDF
jgi:hypothetical protein